MSTLYLHSYTDEAVRDIGSIFTGITSCNGQERSPQEVALGVLDLIRGGRITLNDNRTEGRIASEIHTLLCDGDCARGYYPVDERLAKAVLLVIHSGSCQTFIP